MKISTVTSALVWLGLASLAGKAHRRPIRLPRSRPPTRSRWRTANRRCRSATSAAPKSRSASRSTLPTRWRPRSRRNSASRTSKSVLMAVTSQNRIPRCRTAPSTSSAARPPTTRRGQKDVAFAVNHFYVEEVRIAGQEVPGIKDYRRPERQDRRHDHRHHFGAAAHAQEQGGATGLDMDFVLGQGPRRQLPAARIRPRRRLRDGWPDPPPGNRQSRNPADFEIVGEAAVGRADRVACFRKDDPAFKKAVDDSITGRMKTGEFAKLYDKWFMQPIPPKNTADRPADEPAVAGQHQVAERQASHVSSPPGLPTSCGRPPPSRGRRRRPGEAGSAVFLGWVRGNSI